MLKNFLSRKISNSPARAKTNAGIVKRKFL